MTSDFKPEVVVWLKLHMRTEKSPQLGERQRRTVKLFTSYRKSMSLNPFPVTYIFSTGSKIAALSYCAWADIIFMFQTGGIRHTPSSLEHYLVYNLY